MAEREAQSLMWTETAYSCEEKAAHCVTSIGGCAQMWPLTRGTSPSFYTALGTPELTLNRLGCSESNKSRRKSHRSHHGNHCKAISTIV